MATFQIDSIFLDGIKALIKKKDNTLLKRKLQPVHYADLGEVIEGLSIEEATYLIKLLGSDQVLVKCADDITRRGRIRGKLKRRIWIRDNDIVIIAPWDFKFKERGDIIWRFTLPQVDWLKNNNHIAKDF